MAANSGGAQAPLLPPTATATSATAVADASRSAAQDTALVACMFAVWAGSYFCRTALFVVATEFKQEEGISSEQFGSIMAAGYVAYVVGKLFFGAMTDRIGGANALLIALLGSAAGTWLFASGSSTAVFLPAWMGIRLVQAAGWSGLLKLIHTHVAPSRHGRATGLISVSYLVGDAVSRGVFAALLARYSLGWRQILVAGGGCTACFAGLVFLFLPKPAQHPSPAASSAKAVLPSDAVNRFFERWAADARNLFQSPAFATLCGLSFLYTLTREVFTSFSVEYLVETGATASLATTLSTAFPLCGVPACLLAGHAVDTMANPSRRGQAVAWFAVPAAAPVALLALSSSPPVWLSAACLGLAGFCVIGPYTLLAGSYTLLLSSHDNVATAAGIVDAAGYCGAILIMVASGWLHLHRLLGLVASLLALGAALSVLFGRQYSQARLKG